MPLDDRVCAGRVDESDVGEEWRGMRPVDDSRTLLTLGGPLAVGDDCDPVGRGRDAFRHHVLAEQGVEQAGLAGVELAGHDDHEQPVEVAECGADVGDVLVLGPEATEEHLEVRDGLPLASGELAERRGDLEHRRKIPLRPITPSWPQHSAVRLP